MYFLAEHATDRAPKRLEDAFNALKHPVVREAAARGANIMRQGEWFAIPTIAAYVRTYAGRRARGCSLSAESCAGKRRPSPTRGSNHLSSGRPQGPGVRTRRDNAHQE